MKPKIRIKTANRSQSFFDVIDYENLISENHKARIIVNFVERLDLATFYEDIKVREGLAGRSAIDPKLLLCIWLYATVEGIGSARLLEKLCQRDNAYRWICGGVTINYHTLSDFRTENGSKLDQLLTDIVSAFISAGIVKLKNVAIDGTKISANASHKSFKTKKQLNKLKKIVQNRVIALRQELIQDSQASSKRIEAKRKSAVLEREKKINDALLQLPALEAIKESRKNKVKRGTKVSEAKISTTDLDARIMKFADGSIDAGYNCQVAIDPENYIVLSVDAVTQGNDKNLLKPMIENIESRYEKRPERALIDSGYLTHQDIIDLATDSSPVLIYSPPSKKKDNIKAENLRKRQKKEESYAQPVKDFYKRMENRISKKYYKKRGRIETLNGILHNRMSNGFRLRSKSKVKSELLLQVIGHNILQSYKLNAPVLTK